MVRAALLQSQAKLSVWWRIAVVTHDRNRTDTLCAQGGILALPRFGAVEYGNVMPNAPEPSGGFIAAAASSGVLRSSPQLMHREFSSKSGKAKTPAKLQASLRNLAKAKAARAARRAMK